MQAAVADAFAAWFNGGGGVCTKLHNVHEPPSAFFNGPKTKVFMFGLPWVGFDLQENIDSFWESIRVNPYMDPYTDIWYVLFYVVLWTLFHVAWQQIVVKNAALRFLPTKALEIHAEKLARKAIRHKKQPQKEEATVVKASGVMHTSEDNHLEHRHHGHGADTTSTQTDNNTNGTDDTETKPKKVVDIFPKFITAGWKAFAYELLFLGGMYVWTGHDWWYPSDNWYRSWPQCMEWDVRQFFCLYFGFYISETLFLFYEPKMKDRPVMVVHHIATTGLLLTSYYQGFYRVALPVMILHDFSDPFMEVAKLVNYCELKIFGKIPVADLVFVTFAVAFFVTRLFMFPVFIISSVMWEATLVCEYCNGLYIWLIFFGMLMLLHIYWSTLIVRMIFDALLTRKVSDDIRNDDDGDDD